MSLEAFEDPSHEGNSARYHTGKECIEPGCHQPARTKWSPYWCFSCNVTRMKRIGSQLKAMQRQMREMESHLSG